jgi:superfamily II DNA/RNA helicase
MNRVHGQWAMRCRQTVLVSATLQDRLATLAGRLLKDPVAVGLHLRHHESKGLVIQEEAGHSEAFKMPAGLQQLFVDVPSKLRLPTLLGVPFSLLCIRVALHTSQCAMVGGRSTNSLTCWGPHLENRLDK